MNDFWFRLYQLLKNAEKVTLGPTIPYVIGAYRLKFQVDDFGISDLLTILTNGPINSRITYCNNIEAYVLTADSYVCNSREESSKNSYLSYGGGLGSQGNAITILTAEYNSELKESRFSRNQEGTEWLEFSEEDKLLINCVSQLI